MIYAEWKYNGKFYNEVLLIGECFLMRHFRRTVKY